MVCWIVAKSLAFFLVVAINTISSTAIGSDSSLAVACQRSVQLICFTPIAAGP